jgi:uncharacterized protein YjbI with pentapeptide repeats
MAAARSTWAKPVLSAIAILVLIYVVVIFLPTRIADTRAFRDARDAFAAQNDIRRTLLQACGAAALLIGAYVVWRRIQDSRELLNQNDQLNQRLTWALDILGKGKSEAEALASIYALDDVASRSLDNRQLIGRVLCAYIRTQSPWPPCRPGQYVSNAPLKEIPTLQARAPGVHAAITVLVRGEFSFDKSKPLELSAVDLRIADLQGGRLPLVNLTGASLQGANLQGANLRGANLAYADVRGAYLVGAQLESADLYGADIAGARLANAHLEQARLVDVNLAGSDLSFAHFEGADLRGANLQDARFDGADLRRANLEGARFDGADLRRANLEGARFDGARADENTIWPEGFDRREAGVTGGPRTYRRSLHPAWAEAIRCPM